MIQDKKYKNYENSGSKNIRDVLNKNFNRLYITNRDLHECINYLGHIKLTKPTDLMLRAFLTAAIVSYVRPWSGNKAHVRADSKPDIPLKKLLNHRSFECHLQLCTVRNKIIGHSDFEWNTCGWIASTDNSGYMVSGRFYDLMDIQIDIDKFDSIAEKIFLFTCDRLQELSIQLRNSSNTSIQTTMGLVR